jgi:hypothetical protein
LKEKGREYDSNPQGPKHCLNSISFNRWIRNSTNKGMKMGVKMRVRNRRKWKMKEQRPKCSTVFTLVR